MHSSLLFMERTAGIGSFPRRHGKKWRVLCIGFIKRLRPRSRVGCSHTILPRFVAFFPLLSLCEVTMFTVRWVSPSFPLLWDHVSHSEMISSLNHIRLVLSPLTTPRINRQLEQVILDHCSPSTFMPCAGSVNSFT